MTMPTGTIAVVADVHQLEHVSIVIASTRGGA